MKEYYSISRQKSRIRLVRKIPGPSSLPITIQSFKSVEEAIAFCEKKSIVYQITKDRRESKQIERKKCLYCQNYFNNTGVAQKNFCDNSCSSMYLNKKRKEKQK